MSEYLLKTINDTLLKMIKQENRDIDEFANQLLLKNIKVLCDVRKNPISMKYGFSKKQLKDTFEKIDIKYVHIPELGIDSDKRKNAALDKLYSASLQLLNFSNAQSVKFLVCTCMRSSLRSFSFV